MVLFDAFWGLFHLFSPDIVFYLFKLSFIYVCLAVFFSGAGGFLVPAVVVVVPVVFQWLLYVALTCLNLERWWARRRTIISKDCPLLCMDLILQLLPESINLKWTGLLPTRFGRPQIQTSSDEDIPKRVVRLSRPMRQWIRDKASPLHFPHSSPTQTIPSSHYPSIVI